VKLLLLAVAVLAAAPILAQTPRYPISDHVDTQQAANMLREFAGDRCVSAFNPRSGFALGGKLEVKDKPELVFSQLYIGKGEMETFDNPIHFALDSVTVGSDTVTAGALFAAYFIYRSAKVPGTAVSLLLRFYPNGRAVGAAVVTTDGKETDAFVAFSAPVASDDESLLGFVNETSQVFSEAASETTAASIMRWAVGTWHPISQ
jgi:hypothetical protein